MKRMLCYHPWHRTNGEVVPPSLVVGCCPRNFTCPVCGFGAGDAPHENCQGWDEVPTLANRMLGSIPFYEATRRGERELEAGQSANIGDVKRQLGDT